MSRRPRCAGRSGAGDVAQKIAAIEVLKRGVDRFLIINASTGSEFGGFIGGIPAQRAQTGIVVRIPLPTDPDYDRALSAKQMLGPDWEKQVAKGTPSTC